MGKEKVAVALLMNDIHVSKDNIPEFQKNWDEALSICKENNIGDMIIGGDLWQSRSSQTLSTLMAVRQAIVKATNNGIYLTIAEGNHCKVDQESLLGYSHIFSGYQNVLIVDDYIKFADLSDKFALYVMSYFPENGSFTSKLKEVESILDNSTLNILYIHEGINGALAQPNEKEVPTKIFKSFDAVLVGHYHNRCKIKDTNIEYIGSSRQHNFGEDEEKGYTILYDDGSYDFVKNQANIRYKVLDITSKNLNENFIERLNEIKDDGRYKVKTRINCTKKDASTIDKQKLLDAGATKVEIVTEDVEVQNVTSDSLDKKFDKRGLKQEYMNFCADKGIANVEMGMEYLEKIS